MVVVRSVAERLGNAAGLGSMRRGGHHSRHAKPSADSVGDRLVAAFETNVRRSWKNLAPLWMPSGLLIEAIELRQVLSFWKNVGCGELPIWPYMSSWSASVIAPGFVTSEPP